MQTFEYGTQKLPGLTTLPGDAVRRIMWGIDDRLEIERLTQSVRSVARGPIARLVAGGARESHEWMEGQNGLLRVLDEAGVTALFNDAENGELIGGPKNTALGLAAFELAWVDGGAAMCSLASYLASVPNEKREATEQRTRAMVGLMTASKALSAIEPILRHQRSDGGLSQDNDALSRLVDIWAAGEAAAALGFVTTRFFDEFDSLERRRNEIFGPRDVSTDRAKLPASMKGSALEYLRLKGRPETTRNARRLAELEADEGVQLLIKDSVALVLSPAVKLWNTGHGASILREAASLMDDEGGAEDCPGFVFRKWMDAQLEANYQGSEAAQRRQLSRAMTDELFLAQFHQWIPELRRVAAKLPGTGACSVASAMELWEWTLRHLLETSDANGAKLYRDERPGVTFPMADALGWLLASGFQILSLVELSEQGREVDELAKDLPGFVSFFSDLCHVQAASAAGEVARICTGLVYGYNRHPSWDTAENCCFHAEDLDSLEGIMPGIGACAGAIDDVLESNGRHAAKAGPCVRFVGVEGFVKRRNKLDGCLTGAGLARDRAARALAEVKIPDALDYPA